jgi:L-ascorbate metabolism protein UlaG (beta-lactamase superfamily)
MLETTFIGHQGWQFATAGARILVDPLLVEPFGHGGGVGVVYPPRQIDIPAIPPVDAVILTHEHEDHFNIPSVNRISREVPFHVPERSSSAMRQFLQEAGFSVFPMSAGRTIEWNDLQLTSFSSDHVRHDEQDEWDTMPFLVQDTKDGGSFFSPVDVTTSAGIEAQLQQRGVAPGRTITVRTK